MNSDQTENRESEIPTSCMGIGRRADHDKPKTMVCSHLADPRNQERCQTTTTRNFSIGAASEDTASSDVLDCKLHGRGIDSVGDSMHIMTLFFLTPDT